MQGFIHHLGVRQSVQPHFGAVACERMGNGVLVNVGASGSPGLVVPIAKTPQSWTSLDKLQELEVYRWGVQKEVMQVQPLEMGKIFHDARWEFREWQAQMQVFQAMECSEFLESLGGFWFGIR